MTTKELRVSPKDTAKRVLFLAKEMLLQCDFLEFASGSDGAPVVVRAVETLVRLGYVTYEKIKTDTILVEDKRRTKFLTLVKKTENFQELYDENEEIRRKTQDLFDDNNFE